MKLNESGHLRGRHEEKVTMETKTENAETFSSRRSGFLPQSKDVRVRLIGQAKLPVVFRDV